MSENIFAGRTMVMSGGSRGIGFEIASAFAGLGGNVVLLAKTDTPHPRLPGTVHSAVAEIAAAGGRAVAVVGDVRNDADVERAATTAVREFGGIDLCVNNASVLDLSTTENLAMKKFDLMQEVNVRGTFSLTQACLPELRKSPHAQILTLSPPMNMSQHWLGKHPGYMLAKYGMTLLAMGFAAEFADVPIASTCLWPETTIATSAVINLLGGAEAAAHARRPKIMSDAAMAIVANPREYTGRCVIDVDVLAAAGITDLSGYGGQAPFDYDIFVDPR
ncbi:SDR family oxidoreductase [Nocardia sp. NPDC004860]|uniref:SDR family oxidoreductase n=1 Tax=Nocardia sp. NPDC004860 TaxID=3154557 RepID=UPI0033B46107